MLNYEQVDALIDVFSDRFARYDIELLGKSLGLTKFEIEILKTRGIVEWLGEEIVSRDWFIEEFISHLEDREEAKEENEQVIQLDSFI